MESMGGALRGLVDREVCSKIQYSLYLDLNYMKHIIGSTGLDEPSFIEEASFVRAPLNSRVSMSPAVTIGKGKGKAESLDRVPVEIQEALILEDLLFVLMVRLRLCDSPFAYITYLYREYQERISPYHQITLLKTKTH